MDKRVKKSNCKHFAEANKYKRLLNTKDLKKKAKAIVGVKYLYHAEVASKQAKEQRLLSSKEKSVIFKKLQTDAKKK